MTHPSATDWISSIGIVLAFAVTLFALLREMRIRRSVEHDDQVRRARLVLVAEPVRDRSEHGVGLADFVRVVNYSDEPILDVVVRLASGPDDNNLETRWIEQQFIGPGETAEFEFVREDPAAHSCMSEPELWFMDFAGRRWRRTATGSEPRRMFDYIPPGLEPFRQEIMAERRDSLRLRRRLSRLFRKSAAT